MNIHQIKLHNFNQLGDKALHCVKVTYEDVKPGLYYWVGDESNVFKALVIVGSYVIGVKHDQLT